MMRVTSSHGRKLAPENAIRSPVQTTTMDAKPVQRVLPMGSNGAVPGSKRPLRRSAISSGQEPTWSMS